ncbi:hypothetical protein ACFQE1_04830 [Halobium palmae]|uniref:Uncharacterized protein n=1 Tax=Halobium palmae TaxID=1776492 RepID=A0ABD5RX06_9EURY
MFRSPQTNAAALSEFGLNNEQIEVAQEKLVPGKAGKGHSTCLVSSQDQRGWIETCVEAPPALHRVLTWPPRRVRRRLRGLRLRRLRRPGVTPRGRP